jgi:hypothetical protein
VAYHHRRSPSIAETKPGLMNIDKAWEPMPAALAHVGRDLNTL